ncbi:MAG TPA: cupin domain-containing protein [Chitinophagaceae bacterium]|jgi:quercetin dioxygenase-like cupin family protein|nr:cupin domain-containing protein [Chitinophagaceae bacterium]
MSDKDEEIVNIRTGQRMIFRKPGNNTEKDCLTIECFNPSTAVKEPEHVHPLQESSFEVISGNMSFQVNGKIHIIGPGESIVIPKGTPHFFWNESGTEVHSLQCFRPALHIAGFFRTFFTLAKENKLNEKGLPNLFLISIISLKHQNEIRLVKPPWALQKMLFTFLAPIGRALGYKTS